MSTAVFLSLCLSLCLPLFLCVSITLLQGAAVTGLLLMQQNYAIGLSGQKTIFPLYLFFVSFRVSLPTFPQKAYVLVPSLQCRPLIDNCFSAY